MLVKMISEGCYNAFGSYAQGLAGGGGLWFYKDIKIQRSR